MSNPAFLHGVQIQEVTSLSQPITAVSSSVIGLVGTSSDTTDFPLNTPVLVTPGSSLVANANGSGITGTIGHALNGIFNECSTAVIVVNVGLGSDAGLSEVIGSSSANTGVYALTHAEAITGFVPRILIAPTFSNQTGVATAMDAVASRLRAISIIEGPNTTDANAVTFAATLSSDREYLVDPKFYVFDELNAVPNSARVAGVIAATDNSLGFWYSPSNKQFQSVIGTARPIDYRRSDQYCAANILNEANVATVINQSGQWLLWGNRATSGNFLVSRRIADIIEDSIESAMAWAIDRPVDATYLQDVAAKVNAFLATLKNKGAIIDGKCWPDAALNTPSNLSAGQVYFDFDYVGPYPAEQITFKVAVNNGYLTEITSSGSVSL